MAFVSADRVSDTTTVTGTGNVTVAGVAPTGYRTFSAVLSVGDTFYYCISDQTSGKWETGVGTYVSANVFARTTVLSSSNSGSLVAFTDGTKTVFMTLAAAQTLQTTPGTVGASAVNVIATSSTTARTLANRFADVFNVKDFGAVGNGTTNDTSAIQAAIDAAYGSALFFPAGSYKITSAVNILKSISIYGVQGATTIILGTQNQNGFVVGDGTSGTRDLAGQISIENFIFNPLQGTTAFTSGSCIFLNYVYGTKIQNCIFYGADSIATKLYHGVTAFQVQEYWVTNCLFSKLLGNGHVTSGSSGAGLRTVDGRIDFCEFIEITLDCVSFGAYTEGMTLNCPVAYSYSANAVSITSSLYNIFILQPDFEIDGSSSGIYVANCGNVQIVGGWLGAGSSSTLTGLSVASTASGVSVIGTIFSQASITLNGPACQLVGCDVVGLYPLSGSYVGISISSTANNTVITGNKIRQWSNAGISFTGTSGVAVISGNTFVSNTNDVLGGAWSPSSASIATVSGNSTDFGFAVTAATTITLSPARNYYQVIGATNVRYISAAPAGATLIIQAGAGGITLLNGSGANTLILKGGVNASVPAYSVIEFMSDGIEWIELSRNF